MLVVINIDADDALRGRVHADAEHGAASVLPLCLMGCVATA